jgi:hypothetical protein
MRASKELRTAINANPGLANSLRQVAMETTGIKDLDMYSVTNLYDEIDLVAKRQQQAQQAQAKAYEEGLKRFVKDTANAMSETQAAAAYASMTDDQRVQMAQDAFRTEQAKKTFKENLEAGGTAVENGVTSLVASLSTGNVDLMNAYRLKLKEAGIDEVALVSNRLTDEQRADPKIKALLNEGAAIHRNYIENGYKEALSLINANPNVDATSRRRSLEYLQNWRNRTLEDLNKNGPMTILGAMVTANEKDPYQTLQARLGIVNNAITALNIPADVLQGLSAADPGRRGQNRALMDPVKLAAYDQLETLRNAAMGLVPDPEWWKLVEKTRILQNSPTVPVPVTRTEATATVLVSETAIKNMRDKAATGERDTASTLKALSSGFALKGQGDDLLQMYSKALETQMRLIPQGERAAVMQQVASSFDASVYGATGHGDEVYNRVKALEGQFALVNSKPVFQDSSGTTPLAIRLVGKGTPLREDYSKVALAEPSDKKVNAALASVDTAIRLRSLATGEDVRVLRKQFIDTFNKGKPSEVFTSLPATAAPSAGEGTGAAKEPAKKPLVSDWLSR